MIAIDTNIFVYRFDQKEPGKQTIAKNLLARLARDGQSRLLWQVAGELLNQLTYWQHKRLLERQQVARMFKQTRKLFPLALPSEQTLAMRFSCAKSIRSSIGIACCLVLVWKLAFQRFTRKIWEHLARLTQSS
jgi:predicted nucleic acid-binding protein